MKYNFNIKIKDLIKPGDLFLMKDNSRNLLMTYFLYNIVPIKAYYDHSKRDNLYCLYNLTDNKKEDWFEDNLNTVVFLNLVSKL